MRKEMWPDMLMLCGFDAVAIFLGLLLFAHLSPALNVVATIGENISIGVGSVGMGNRIAQARRKNRESSVHPVEQ